MTENRPDGSAPDGWAYLMLFIAPVLMASNMLAARWVEGSIPAVSLAFWRWALTLVVLAPFVAGGLWRRRALLAAEWRTVLVLGALGMGVCGPPVYLGAQTTTATNIGMIYASTPILIVLLARLFWGAPVSPTKAAGIALCLAGVVTIIARGDPSVLLSLSFAPGDLWIVFAALGWALYSVLLRYRPSRLPLTERFAAIVLGGVVCMLPFYAAEMALGHWPPATLETAGIMVFLALVPGLAAYLLYGRLVAQLGAQRTGMLMYLVPLYNAGLAYLLLAEMPQLFHVAGAALILPGLYLATRSEPAPARAALGPAAAD